MLGALLLAPVLLGLPHLRLRAGAPAARQPGAARGRARGRRWRRSSRSRSSSRGGRRGCPSPRSFTLPFRVPIASGGSTANLLVPLYLVVAAGVLAVAVPALRRAPSPLTPSAARPRSSGRSPRVVALYARAGGVLRRLRPGAGERRLLLRAVRAAVRAARAGARGRRGWRARASACSSALALVFAAIGFVEYATRHLLLEPEGHRLQPVRVLLPGQLAVLRPEHLRALPGARDARRRPPWLLWAREQPRRRRAARRVLAVLWAGARR